MEIGTFTTRHELYSLDYRTDLKVTWKQISGLSCGKQDHDIGIKKWNSHSSSPEGQKLKTKISNVNWNEPSINFDCLKMVNWDNFDPIL